MSNTTTSTNMSMPVPVPGEDSGPQWAIDLNTCLSIIDNHNHTSGNGVVIPTAGISINADFPFNGYAGIDISGLSLAVQTGNPSTNVTLYAKGVDLYYRDGDGNVIRLTASGGPNAGTGNIQNLPSTPSGGAGISWANAQSTFQFFKDSGTVGANGDFGTVVLRYPGSYPTPSGNYIALQAPTSLASGFALTLPATLPAANGALFTSDTAGALSYSFADNSTLQLSAGYLQIKDGGVTKPKLAALGQQISSSCGTYVYSGTFGAYQDVTNLTVTITTTGRPVFIGLIGATGTISRIQVASGVSSYRAGCNIKLLGGVGGVTTLTTYEFETQNDPASTGAEMELAPSVVWYIDRPSAGTQIYKIQTAPTDALGDLVGFLNVQLIAYEL